MDKSSTESELSVISLALLSPIRIYAEASDINDLSEQMISCWTRLYSCYYNMSMLSTLASTNLEQFIGRIYMVLQSQQQETKIKER